MLDSVDLKVRLSKATESVDRHLQSIHVAEKITQKVQCQLSKSQKEFLLRQQMRAIKEELGDNDDLEACTEGVESFLLDKWSGKNCSMISARGLHIDWTSTSRYWRYVSLPESTWRYVSLPESRFGEVAELLLVCWLQILGKIDMRMLSPSTMYDTYLVFKLISMLMDLKTLLWWSMWLWLVENPLSRRCYWTQTQREGGFRQVCKGKSRQLVGGGAGLSFSLKGKNMGSWRWIMEIQSSWVRGVFLLKGFRSDPKGCSLGQCTSIYLELGEKKEKRKEKGRYI